MFIHLQETRRKKIFRRLSLSLALIFAWSLFLTPLTYAGDDKSFSQQFRDKAEAESKKDLWDPNKTKTQNFDDTQKKHEGEKKGWDPSLGATLFKREAPENEKTSVSLLGDANQSTRLAGGERHNIEGKVAVGTAGYDLDYSAGVTKNAITANAKVGARATAFEGELTGQTGFDAGGIQNKTTGKVAGMAGAMAEAQGDLKISKHGVTAAGGVDLFAGGKAQGEVCTSVGCKALGINVEAKVRGEVSAGAGVQAKGNFQIDGGKIKIGGALAGAIGLGAGGAAEVTVDVSEMIDKAAKKFNELSDWLGGLFESEEEKTPPKESNKAEQKTDGDKKTQEPPVPDRSPPPSIEKETSQDESTSESQSQGPPWTELEVTKPPPPPPPPPDPKEEKKRREREERERKEREEKERKEREKEEKEEHEKAEKDSRGLPPLPKPKTGGATGRVFDPETGEITEGEMDPDGSTVITKRASDGSVISVEEHPGRYQDRASSSSESDQASKTDASSSLPLESPQPLQAGPEDDFDQVPNVRELAAKKYVRVDHNLNTGSLIMRDLHGNILGVVQKGNVDLKALDMEDRIEKFSRMNTDELKRATRDFEEQIDRAESDMIGIASEIHIAEQKLNKLEGQKQNLKSLGLDTSNIDRKIDGAQAEIKSAEYRVQDAADRAENARRNMQAADQRLSQLKSLKTESSQSKAQVPVPNRVTTNRPSDSSRFDAFDTFQQGGLATLNATPTAVIDAGPQSRNLITGAGSLSQDTATKSDSAPACPEDH